MKKFYILIATVLGLNLAYADSANIEKKVIYQNDDKDWVTYETTDLSNTEIPSTVCQAQTTVEAENSEYTFSLNFPKDADTLPSITIEVKSDSDLSEMKKTAVEVLTDVALSQEITMYALPPQEITPADSSDGEVTYSQTFYAPIWSVSRFIYDVVKDNQLNANFLAYKQEKGQQIAFSLSGSFRSVKALAEKCLGVKNFGRPYPMWDLMTNDASSYIKAVSALDYPEGPEPVWTDLELSEVWELSNSIYTEYVNGYYYYLNSGEAQIALTYAQGQKEETERLLSLFTKELQDLESEKVAVANALLTLPDKMEVLDDEIEADDKLLPGLENANTKAQNELAAVKSLNAEVQKRADQLDGDVIEYEGQVLLYEGKLEEATDQLAGYRQDYADAVEELASLNSQYDIVALDSSLASYQNQQADLEDTLAGYATQLAELDSKKRELRTTERRRKKKLTEAKTAWAESNNKLANIPSENEELRASIEEKKALKQEKLDRIPQLQERKSQFEERYNARCAQNGEAQVCKQALARIEKYRQDIEGLFSEERELLAEIEVLEGTIEDNNTLMNSLPKKISRLNERVQQRQESYDQVVTQISNNASRIEGFAVAQARMEAKLNRVDANLATVAASVDSYYSQKEVIDADLVTAENKSELAAEKVVEYKQELTAYETSLRDTTAARDAYFSTDDYINAAQKLAAALESANLTSKAYNEINSRYNSNVELNEQYQEEYDSALERDPLLPQEIEDAQNSLTQTEEDLLASENALEELEKDLEEKQTVSADSIQKVLDQEEELIGVLYYGPDEEDVID